MNRSKAPSDARKAETWMPLLVDKYLGDTTHLTTEQHGGYMLLLMTAWKREGRLPNDDGQLATIARLAPARWRAHRGVLLEFFRLDDEGFLTQKRLTIELQRANVNIGQRSAAGKASAEARAARRALNETDNEQANENSTAVATKPPTDLQQNPKPIPLPTPTESPHTPQGAGDGFDLGGGGDAGDDGGGASEDDLAYPADFLRFWEACPRKVGKGAAAKAWAKLRPTPAVADRITAAMLAQREGFDTRESGRFVPHPSTWLNERRFDDELPPVRSFLGSSEGRSGNGVAL
jgi:uncharacterized protein YdaU (DUF1376 family)